VRGRHSPPCRLDSEFLADAIEVLRRKDSAALLYEGDEGAAEADLLGKLRLRPAEALAGFTDLIAGDGLLGGAGMIRHRGGRKNVPAGSWRR